MKGLGTKLDNKTECVAKSQLHFSRSTWLLPAFQNGQIWRENCGGILINAILIWGKVEKWRNLREFFLRVFPKNKGGKMEFLDLIKTNYFLKKGDQRQEK